MAARRIFCVLGSAALVQAGFSTQAGAAEPNAEGLTVVAASSARPQACARQSQLWDRARRPRAESACDLMLRASALMVKDAEGARALAEQAFRLAPQRPEPLVLLGRAFLALGDYEEASLRLAAAEKLNADALATPLELLAAARVSVHLSRYALALERYRKLIPRAELLVDRRERQRALLEASIVAQLVSLELMPEARAYAAEARRQGELYYAELSRAVLALALSRQGRAAEAAAVAREAGGPWMLTWLFELEGAPRGVRGELTPLWPLAEREALIAVLAEPEDAELARQAWGQYLRTAARTRAPAHVLEHARQRFSALGGSESIFDADADVEADDDAADMP